MAHSYLVNYNATRLELGGRTDAAAEKVSFNVPLPAEDDAARKALALKIAEETNLSGNDIEIVDWEKL